MKIRAWTTATALALAAISTGTPAHAEDETLGRKLFDEGVALMNKGDYAKGCPKLEESYQAFSGIGTRGKLAECYEKWGKLATAWALYKDVADLAKDAKDKVRADVARERAIALEPKLAHLSVLVPPAARAPGLTVSKNGVAIDPRTFGSAVPVDAGKYTIRAIAPGRKPFVAEVTLADGAFAQTEVVLAMDAQVAPPPTPPVIPIEPPRDERSGGGWQKPTGLVVGGAGLVVAVVGGAIGLSAKSTYDEAFDSGACDAGPKLCSQAGQDSVDSARSKAGLSTGLVIGGLALTGLGAVLILTAPSQKTGLRLAPTMTAGGGGLVLGGTL